MKKYIINLKYIVLGVFISLNSCVDDSLPDVGDLPDFSAPTPFYNVADVSSSEFDCNDVELSANYDFNFQAGSNLAVNGTQYLWSVTPSDGVVLINKDLPILNQLIEVEKAAVVALEKQIAKLEFKLPCETNTDKIAVFEAQIEGLKVDLQAAKDALTEENLQNIADLESQIANLPAASLQDQELIFSFPNPDTYTVQLTVTDNLGKSESTEKTLTVNQAVPIIPVPEIQDAGFEDGNLFLVKKDGTGGWRVPGQGEGIQPNGDRSLWHPTGANSFAAPQINTKALGVLPEGTQAGKFPADGSRVAYQEIEVTPGASYVLTYFSAFNLNNDGNMKVSILHPDTGSFTEAQLEENIIATRTDNNVGRIVNVFKKHAINFDAGENESVIIFATNTGDEVRLDAFDIIVKQ